MLKRMNKHIRRSFRKDSNEEDRKKSKKDAAEAKKDKKKLSSNELNQTQQSSISVDAINGKQFWR